MAKLKAPYWERSGFINAKCDKCGAEQTKNLKRLKTFVKHFEPVNWFRGDDELIETLCERCCRELKAVDAAK